MSFTSSSQVAITGRVSWCQCFNSHSAREVLLVGFSKPTVSEPVRPARILCYKVGKGPLKGSPEAEAFVQALLSGRAVYRNRGSYSFACAHGDLSGDMSTQDGLKVTCIQFEGNRFLKTLYYSSAYKGHEVSHPYCSYKGYAKIALFREIANYSEIAFYECF